MFKKPDIVLKHVTIEMREWLTENYSNEKYHIKPHMIRYRYAGPNIPLNKCQRQKGWEILFVEEEDAMAFKLRWM